MKTAFIIALGVLAGTAWSKEAKKEKVWLAIDGVVFNEGIWERELEEVMDELQPAEPEDLDGEDEPDGQEKTKKEEREVEHSSKAADGFSWLSSEQRGMRAGPGSCTLLDQKVGEVVIRGESGIVGDVSISIFNRGDDGDIPVTRQQKTMVDWKALLDLKLGVRAETRDSKGAVATSGWVWRKGDSAYLLESSVNRSERRAEFVRLRIASISAAKNRSTGVTKRSSLDENVKKDDKGFVFLDGVPMVDQGEKGYCVVATVERVARYFGLETDQHELAQLSDTDEGGTSGEGMQQAFQRITGKLHVRTLKLIEYDERQLAKDIRSYNREAKGSNKATFDYDPDEWVIHPAMFWSEADPLTFRTMKSRQNSFDHFNRKVKEYVDQGIPLCWTLYLGMFKEGKLPQESGGHMRMIIGYNFDDPEVPKLYYTDSWGEGHERKMMRADEAYCMTMGLYAMVPNR